MTGRVDHCASYYAATATDAPDYPVLAGEVEVDVAIVGGGLTGLATALMLAERGYSVALLEARRIGWGASGRNGGQIIGGMSGEAAFRRQLGREAEAFLWSIHYRGNEIVTNWVARYEIACDLKRGWMLVASKPRHRAELVEELEAHERHGLAGGLELIEARDLPDILATNAYHGGLVSSRSGHLHPLNLCLGEARAAAGLGVRIFEGSEVTGIEHGARPVAVTAKGRVRAGSILLAGGAYHRLERRRLGGITFPTGSYIVATEPLGDDLAGRLNPRDLAVCDTNLILDYYRLSADKRMLFGGRCNYSNREPRDIAGSIAPRMVEIFPDLADKRIDFAWGGKIGININRIPAFGRVSPNVYYVQGYSGHGVNFSHIAAETVADAIAGTTERFDVFDRIRQVRIPASQWIGNQLLALGMSYFRLRDLF